MKITPRRFSGLNEAEASQRGWAVGGGRRREEPLREYVIWTEAEVNERRAPGSAPLRSRSRRQGRFTPATPPTDGFKQDRRRRQNRDAGVSFDASTSN